MIRGKSELSILPMVLHGLKGAGTAPPSLGSVDDLLANPRPNCPGHGQIWLWVSDSDFRQADVNLLQWFGWLLMFIGVFKRNKVICGQLGRKKTPVAHQHTPYQQNTLNTNETLIISEYLSLQQPQHAPEVTMNSCRKMNEWTRVPTFKKVSFLIQQMRNTPLSLVPDVNCIGSFKRLSFLSVVLAGHHRRLIFHCESELTGEEELGGDPGSRWV